MRKLLIFGCVLCVGSAAAQTGVPPAGEDILKKWGISEDPKPPAPTPQGSTSDKCWTISRPTAPGTIPAVVLLDQCSGNNYVLASVDAPGGYYYQWRRVSFAEQPAVFKEFGH